MPFQFKCFAGTTLFVRCDAAVLYFAKRHYAIVREIAADVRDACAAELHPAVPAFTKRVAPGIGLGEDPVTGESFGGLRCRLVAEGLWDGLLTDRPGVEAVRARFEACGIPLDKPYLNPGSVDLYEALP